jgi:PleD family two-component response regulator
VFSATADETGTVVCTSCGARLRARTPAADGPQRSPARRDIGPALARRGAAAEPALERPLPVELSAAGADPALADALRQVLGEIRAVRKAQERILTLLQPRGEEGGEESDEPFREAAPVRSRKRKSVLLIDDDERTRQEAVSAMQAAEVPVRAVADGTAAMSAIAEERPDVLVLELAVGGPMAGKDVVNVIKATMEWVDIPIVLYTRLPIPSQKEARQIHGADELVAKSPNGVEALVMRVISLFRRG